MTGTTDRRALNNVKRALRHASTADLELERRAIFELLSERESEDEELHNTIEALWPDGLVDPPTVVAAVRDFDARQR